MSNKHKSEEIAVNRLQLITPLLDDSLDRDKKMAIMKELCFQSDLSERTIRRYIHDYLCFGFDGLKPKNIGRYRDSIINDDVINEAIQLRREVPTRSVSSIIRILEWEGKIGVDSIKRSTLQDQLTKHGYSSRQMKIYSDSSSGAKRFQKTHRNRLWHSDVKYGPYINGKQTYMVCFIDDCTRYVLHTEFYHTLDQTIIQDSFRKALIKFGSPVSVFFDNGKQYRTHWMKRACGKLDIRLLYARPYSPESTGKVEIFNKKVDNFLNEAHLKKPKSLDELNRLYHVWVDECHQYQPHSALKGSTPTQAYHGDKFPLRLIDRERIADAFLYCEVRRVDKSGCIDFKGTKYEIKEGVRMVGKKVDVVYDPTNISQVAIECLELPKTTAKPLVIATHSIQRVRLPETLSTIEPRTSRLLDGATIVNDARKKKHMTALSFKGSGEENV